MKKLLALLLTALLVFSLAACGKTTDTGGKKEETAEPTEEVMTTDIGMSEVDGGWADADSVVVSDKLKALFDKVNKTLTGAQLTPVACLESQVVAGTNYLVLCKETATVPNASPVYALVTLYEDLDGNAEVTDLQESGVTAPEPYDPENPVSGGWGEPESPEVTDEAKTALAKACETLTGAEYEAKALLATQIVAGTNYQLLCKAAPTVPDAASYYAIITVYADLEGGAEITQTAGFGGELDEDTGEEGQEVSAADTAEE